MAITKRRLLVLLLLLFFVLKEAKAQEEIRPVHQSASDVSGLLPTSIPQKGCEAPEITHGKVRCKKIGCRILCDTGYKTPMGIAFATLSCDPTSGALTFRGKDMPVEDIVCLPYCGVDGCLNGGTCVEPRSCQCPPGYSGRNCEIAPERPTVPTPGHVPDPNVCQDPDFPVQNAQIMRVGQSLLVRCNEGHVFKNGRTMANIKCRNGDWDRPEGVFCPGGALVCEAPPPPALPPTESRCDPPCQNGGACLPEGVCDCPYRFWGGHCQHDRRETPDSELLGTASLGNILTRMLEGRGDLPIIYRRDEWYIGRGFAEDEDVKSYSEDELQNRKG